MVPSGFSFELEIGEPYTGHPLGFARLPDGRVVIVERQTGVVRIAAVGASSSVEIHVVDDVEGVHPERGLLGIAVDPNWPARPYVYFVYNHTSGFMFVTMYTASGELTNPASTAITLGSPFHLLNDIPDVNEIHNGGSIRFGPDGMLYLSFGEDAQACQAQNLSSPLGSILRLDVSSMPGGGMGPPPKSEITPPDNPFPGPDDWARLRYAWGLRNPYRFTIDSDNGDLMIGDVGSSFVEEVNRIEFPMDAGANFAWPQYEGSHELFCCEQCDADKGFTDPVHVFEHLPGVTSIIGGPTVRANAAAATSFPASYEGSYFYFEFFTGLMRRLVPGAGSTWVLAPPVAGQPDSSNWGLGIFGVTDAQMAPDGAIDLLTFGHAGLPRGFYRITYSPMLGAPLSEEAGGGVNAILARPNPAPRGATVVLTISGRSSTREEHGTVRITIDDVRGRRVRTLWTSAGTGAAWDQRDDAGRAVAAGVYFARLANAGGDPVTGRITILR